MSMSVADRLDKAADNIDSRYHPSGALRRQLNKVFPTHWSFLLGEIALYSFIILLLTGVYLTLFFDPSMAHVTYEGVVSTVARHPDVAGLRDGAEYQLRGPRRTVRPADPPLGGAAVRRVDHGAHGPGVLHRRLPASPAKPTG